jgi:hypothetical protein
MIGACGFDFVARWPDAGVALTQIHVYHVLNRALGSAKMFDKLGDFAPFEKVRSQACPIATALGRQSVLRHLGRPSGMKGSTRET